VSLIENTLQGRHDRVQVAIDRIRLYVQTMRAKGIRVVGAFSGGKDSVVIRELERRAGTGAEWFYNQVGIYPPELVQFIKEYHADIARVLPPMRFFAKMRHKTFPPMMKQRYCCEVLKEYHGDGLVITGVRAAESSRRAKRLVFEPCKRDRKTWFLNPILDWSDEDVWEFIRRENLPYCRLYDEGFKRLGCVLCPMATEKNKRMEAARWPKMANAWKAALWRCHELRIANGKAGLGEVTTPDEALEWYVTLGTKTKQDDDQQCFRFE
jgi:phosphoadenosine phosphosulfate reductase